MKTPSGQVSHGRQTRREFVHRSVAAGLASAGALSPAAFAKNADKPIGVWSERAAMPFAVQDIYPAPFWKLTSGASELKPRPIGVLVSAGGIAEELSFGHRVTKLVTTYDPISDSWGWGPSLPQARHHLSLVFHNGLLYAIGGYFAGAAGHWQMQSSVWRIADLDAPKWSAVTSLPLPQAEFVAASVGGRIHVVGGRAPMASSNADWNDHIDVDMHWAYDARVDRWEPRAPLPVPRHGAAGATVRGALYVIGGRTVSDGNVADCRIYEPVSNRWQAIAPLPAPQEQDAPRGQSSLAAAAWKDNIYVFGGEWFGATSGVYADVWEYDTREDKWRAVASMNRPRHALGAVALSDGIYVCGGSRAPSNEGTSDALDVFMI